MTLVAQNISPEAVADLEVVLAAWQEATTRLEQTHEALREEVRRLTDELEVKNRELARKNRLADLGQMASHVSQEVRNNLESGARTDSEAVERDFSLIDRLLIEELRACIVPEEALEWEKEAKKELKVYKKRLPKDTYEKIYGNFMGDKIHKKFGIGEFSLFHL
jgi:vacuolar-type H+-ATPase subunit I/STV1